MHLCLDWLIKQASVILWMWWERKVVIHPLSVDILHSDFYALFEDANWCCWRCEAKFVCVRENLKDHESRELTLLNCWSRSATKWADDNLFMDKIISRNQYYMYVCIPYYFLSFKYYEWIYIDTGTIQNHIRKQYVEYSTYVKNSGTTIQLWYESTRTHYLAHY